MRSRALAVVVTQAIGPSVAMLMALIIALILLLAAPAKAQETTSEETTVLASDAADRRVEAKTDDVSVEVDNGKVSVDTDNNSSSNDSTNQQSSLTVQQSQAREGSGSRASTRDVNTTQNSSSSCNNSTEVANLAETDADGSVSFSTQGEKFRVSYDVTFDTTAPESKKFSIVVRRNGTQVESVETETDVTDETFFISEGSDNYEIEATLENAGTDTTFDITVDDCRGTDNNGGDRRRDRDDNNRATGRGAADRQYKNEEIVRETVIKKTIPDKGTLANTGGVPLAGAGLLALASVGVGLSILRVAIRRDP